MLRIVPADTPAQVPDCPTCSAPCEDAKLRTDGTMRTGDYLCTAGHVYMMRWLEDGVA